MRTVNPVLFARQKERILNQAGSCFSRLGYGAASMEDVARACRMKKPSLYHYFTGKQALLHALIAGRIQCLHSPERVASILGQGLFATLTNLGLGFLSNLETRRNREMLQLLLRDSFNDAYVRAAYTNMIRGRARQFSDVVYASVKPAISRERFDMAMHQFMSCLMRYALESRIWKNGITRRFGDRRYVRGLAGIFANGLIRRNV